MDDFMSKYRLAMLGTGDIANFHFDAFKLAGFNINMCASKNESKRAVEFAEKRLIKNCYSNPFDLIDDHENWDMILLAIKTDYNYEYLDKIISLNKLCLVEKPVSYDLNILKNYSPSTHPNVRVAYNRRFYKTMQVAKKFIEDNSPTTCRMELPEGINFQSENKFYPVLANTVHGIDLLRYFFGDLKIVKNIETKSPEGRVVLLSNSKDDIINLSLNWNSPSNFLINIEGNDMRLEIKPFESCRLFRGMEIIEPTKDIPLRRYIPNQIDEHSSYPKTENDVKPGFYDQAMEMKNILKGGSPLISASLHDAYIVQKLTQQILGIAK